MMTDAGGAAGGASGAGAGAVADAGSAGDAGDARGIDAPTAEWARVLGLRVPLVCAPMGGAAGGRLASAVSRAGALGMIGMGSSASEALLRRELALLDTDGAAFGIGLAAWGIDRDPRMFEAALEARPAVVSLGFVDWAEPGAALGWIARVHEVGAIVASQVATVDEALLAEEAGVDLIVARGEEAGGHGDHKRPRDLLLAEAVREVSRPVLVAGAMRDGRDLAAALGHGAAGAWAGTAFAACSEALTSSRARQAMIDASGSETTVSSVLDVALGNPWPARFPERLLRTRFVERWHGRETELAHDEAARAELRAALAAEDYSVVPLNAGLGVDALTEVRSAAEVVASFL